MRQYTCDIGTKKGEFQFTHPVRGATRHALLIIEDDAFQFTHPARGATIMRLLVPHRDIVSIHAPHVGCDVKKEVTELATAEFQFTHPMWGAT